MWHIVGCSLIQNVSPYTKTNLFSTKELILLKVEVVFYSFKSCLSTCTYKIEAVLLSWCTWSSSHYLFKVATDPTSRTLNFKRITRNPTSHVIFVLAWGLLTSYWATIKRFLLDVMYVVLVLQGELCAEMKKRLDC